MAKRQRDYKAEYRRRIERGLKRGLSRSQARGHPALNEASIKTGSKAPQSNEAIDNAIYLMHHGTSLSGAAKSVGISANKLSRFIHHHKIGTWTGRGWEMQDARVRRVKVLTNGALRAVFVPNYAEASKASAFEDAAGRFIRTNDREHLLPFIGQGVTDVKGKFIPFETDPNELHSIHGADETPFHEIYDITNPD